MLVATRRLKAVSENHHRGTASFGRYDVETQDRRKYLPILPVPLGIWNPPFCGTSESPGTPFRFPLEHSYPGHPTGAPDPTASTLRSVPWRATRRAPPRWRGSSPTRRVQRPSCAVAVGGVRGGTAPRQPLPGTREAWPQRVGWLSRRSGQTRPPTLGTLGRQNLHTRTLRSPLHAVSTTESEAMSQEFPPGTRGGSGSASGRLRAAPRYTPRGHPG